MRGLCKVPVKKHSLYRLNLLPAAPPPAENKDHTPQVLVQRVGQPDPRQAHQGQQGIHGYIVLLQHLEHLLAHGLLSDDPAERYSTGWLGDVASDARSVDRVCWLAAEITVPAGGSVTLTASMTKAGSYDFYCIDRGNQGLYGYDLVTALGSCLTCTEQRATLEDRGFIEIVRQNFGFDLEAGIRTVLLDMSGPHYYLEVRSSSQ